MRRARAGRAEAALRPFGHPSLLLALGGPPAVLLTLSALGRSGVHGAPAGTQEVAAVTPAEAPAQGGAAAPLATGRSRPVWVEREAWLMGTRLSVRLAARDRNAAVAATELVFAEVRRLEALLSSWRDDSELARLNAAPPGREVRVDPGLAALLLEAEALARRTGGAFDPGVGSLVDAWDLRGEGRRPTATELEEAREAAGIGHFVLRADGTAVRRSAGAWLDTGAFGKGAALRAARDALRAAGVERALLDFGGQILALGPGQAAEERGPAPAKGRAPAAGEPAEAGGWEIAVAHPVRRDEPAARLRLRDASAATTAASERFASADGERLGHILDPRTGRPVPAWGSVTVVAGDPLLADALSTALFVLGPAGGSAWARDEGVAALFLRPAAGGGVSAAWTPAMTPFLAGGAGPDAAAATHGPPVPGDEGPVRTR